MADVKVSAPPDAANEIDELAVTASNLNANEWTQILAALDPSILKQLKPRISQFAAEPAADGPGETMEDKVEWLVMKMEKVIKYIKKNKKSVAKIQKKCDVMEDAIENQRSRMKHDPVARSRVRNAPRIPKPKRLRTPKLSDAASDVSEDEAPQKSTKRKNKRLQRGGSSRKYTDEDDLSQLAGLNSKIDSSRKKFYRFGTRKIQVILPTEGVPTSKDAKLKPEATLELEHAHGYNGNDVQSRDNMFLDENRLCYYIAGTGVVLDTKTGRQNFFRKHNDDISCMGIDPNMGSELIATGQVDPKDYTKKDLPKIWIWNRRTCEKVKLISDCHHGSVLKVAWSSNQPWLYSIGGDENHEFKIWDTEMFHDPNLKKVNGMEKAAGKQSGYSFVSTLHKEEIFGVKVNPFPPTVPSAMDEMVIYGKRKLSHILIMEPRPGKKDFYMKKKDVTFTLLPELKKNKKLLERAYLCVTWLPDGRYVVGAPSGFAYLCERNSPLLRFQAHRDMVGAICLGSVPNQIITSSWDGTIKRWKYDPQNVKMAEADSRTNLVIPDSDFQFKPRAMCYNSDSNEIFIGSKTNQIAKYDFDQRRFELIVDGHDGQVWGLATHPTESIYVTGGHDNVLKLWDANTYRLIDTYEFELGDDDDPEQVMHCAWSDDGRYVAVGTESSKVFIFWYENQDLRLAKCHVIEKKSKSAAVEAIAYLRFSPDSGFLAVAHMDSQGYILSIEGNEHELMMNQWPGMSMPAAPTNLQWSADGTIVKFLTRDYEVCHFNLDYDSQRCHFNPSIPDPDEVKWAGDPLIAGWDVEGLYQPGWDGTDLNDASVSPDGRFIASGDDFGCVRLHKYPAIKPEANRKYLGHSSFVVGIEFTREDHKLITCGGNDMAIFQWKVVGDVTTSFE